MRALSPDQRGCEGSYPTRPGPRMMLSIVSANFSAGSACRTRRTNGSSSFRIPGNDSASEMPPQIGEPIDHEKPSVAVPDLFLLQHPGVGVQHENGTWDRLQPVNLEMPPQIGEPIDHEKPSVAVP